MYSTPLVLIVTNVIFKRSFWMIRSSLSLVFGAGGGSTGVSTTFLGSGVGLYSGCFTATGIGLLGGVSVFGITGGVGLGLGVGGFGLGGACALSFSCCSLAVAV